MAKDANCTGCGAALILEPLDTVYDEERYSANCPSCNTEMVAVASVAISYRVEAYDGSEWLDDSVGVKLAPTASVAGQDARP